ncbi:fatty acyl-CoA reductase 1-like [Schistocerca serialis cubense]|uniref:fatty acyl-CoA reductase 1-like n=1 Tax=Schistocerca serialis cubense TaxID=2023355 RepID=UPI00214F3884|nr:fatty acyl-CoA reductase 1-like [Schistocerca serialis cubense]XP_049942290.1 fatty acyl-CoA reductase 1-like [Schistocerca serialis cubense]
MRTVEGEGTDSGSQVAQWFAGRSALVTGATGFLGKAIVEKLLRCCPDVGTLYLLVRPKRGQDPHARLEAYTSDVVFSKLREERPDFARQLSVVAGDLSAPDFRLAEQDMAALRRDVSVVFHNAASVRFDDTLRQAVTTNVVGTKHVLQLAEQLPHLQVFMYVSTSFCHSDQPVLEERLYPAKADPEKIMDIVSWMDEDLLEALTPKLLGNLPNTYVLSKNLAEKLVADYASRLPIIISRPSIVIPTYKEPLPGWVDNTNGPVGMLLAAGKGLLHSAIGDPDANGDLIPVDCTANAIIALVWHFAQTKPQSPYVCNVANGQRHRVTWGQVLEDYKNTLKEIPVEPGVWYPAGHFTKSVVLHKLIHIFLELLPAYLLDFLIMLSGRRPFLVHIQKRLQTGQLMLNYYTFHEWLFINKKLFSLLEYMSPQDQETFYFDTSEIDRYDYMRNTVIGAKTYLLHEDMANISGTRKRFNRMYWLHCAAQAVFYAFVLWLLYSWSWPLLRAAAVVSGGPGFRSLSTGATSL